MEKLTPGNYPSEVISDTQLPNPPYSLSHQSEILVAGDLRRFTETVEDSESFNLEEIWGFLSKLFDMIADIIAIQGGAINKYLGDGFLAHYRIKNSSDPSAILNRIIIGMFDIINIGFANLRSIYKHKLLGMSIVISMGNVLWGKIGSIGYTDYSMIGNSVNHLFKVLNFAKGNSIIVFPHLKPYLDNNWILIDLGRQNLAGLLRPIELYSVLRPRVDEESNGKLRECVRECRSYHLCTAAYSRGEKGNKIINCQYCKEINVETFCWYWNECKVKHEYGVAKEGNFDDFSCCHVCAHFSSCFHSYYLGKLKHSMIWCGPPNPYQLISQT